MEFSRFDIVNEKIALIMGWRRRGDYTSDNSWLWWVAPEDVNAAHPEDEEGEHYDKPPDCMSDSDAATLNAKAFRDLVRNQAFCSKITFSRGHRGKVCCGVEFALELQLQPIDVAEVIGENQASSMACLEAWEKVNGEVDNW